jgi:hypothetical protein
MNDKARPVRIDVVDSIRVSTSSKHYRLVLLNGPRV